MGSAVAVDSAEVDRPAASARRATSARDATSTLVPGQMFGPYRIERCLGQGGMGEVYAAEDVSQGRRLAIKVLRHQLAGEAERVRFLREGQLAASVNHPNSVYIFGSEDIDDVPVISMEQLPGGTLKDRVREQGPMPAVEAVDAVLQVIAGLDAAHTAGVLHRDVKPSNCFVDAVGRIKIGDFGLSISATARDASLLTLSGSFHGTPQFASPEQLRGEPLDVRADIYSVGATLYCLLTGQPPFDHRNLATLVTRVLTEAPESPRRLRRSIPAGLERIMLRCLAHDRTDRPATYAELADLLQSFGSDVAAPAPLDARVAATAFDLVIVAGIVVLASFVGMALGVVAPNAFPRLDVFFVAAALYWSLFVGLRGTTYGLRVSDLHVVSATGRPPGILRAAVASGTLLLPLILVDSVLGAIAVADAAFPAPWTRMLLVGGGMAAMFVTARSHNGWTGLHQFVSGTGVVERRTRRPALLAGVREPLPAARVPERHLGPYIVLGSLGATESGELLLAFDERLKRHVWIRELDEPLSALDEARRGLDRSGRLRWLNGQRTAGGGWDAYEAPAGCPLLVALERQAPTWRVVRRWLLDLATEMAAGARDGTLRELSMARIWITADGRARILDFQVTGTDDDTPVVPMTDDAFQHFLSDVARRALLDRDSSPLPLSATRLLESLSTARFTSLDQAVVALERLATQPDRVTHRQRGMALALCVVSSVAGGLLLRRLLEAIAPGAMDAVGIVTGGLPFVAAATSFDVVCCAMAGGLWAVLFRGGFWLRAFRIAVVTADGREVSRPLAAARALLAWAWVPAQVAAALPGLGILILPSAVLKYVGIAWTGDHPQRGPHDRLLGTYLVPR